LEDEKQREPQLVKALQEEQLDLSIIDGMQRTTALKEAAEQSNLKHFIRVELWVAKKVDSLIYRMLVLNTGQVPWDIKRQLDTLYRPIVNAIKKTVSSIRIIDLDAPNRRSQAGEYRSTRIIELFLAYTSRSVDIDIKEKVAEEFVKIDLTEATAEEDFLPLFIESLKLMALLDAQFDRASKSPLADPSNKIKSGRDIFTSAPASIGFIVAMAEQLLGSPGFDYDLVEARKTFKKIENNINKLISHMKLLDDEELEEFIDLDTLNQVISVKSGKIGDYERTVYKRAFITLTSKTKQVIEVPSVFRLPTPRHYAASSLPC
jgi:hypothetical protein